MSKFSRSAARNIRPLPAANEAGSAVVEFVLVGVIVAFLVLAIFQFAYALYVRNTLVDAASFGARFAALADTALADGEERARTLSESTLGARFIESVNSEKITVGGVGFVKLKIRARLPIVGLWGPSGEISVTGQAVAE